MTSLSGTNIHYADLGGSGPPLLLLHGITDSLDSYLPTVPELARKAHVFAMDFRGHGGSAHTPDRYRLRDYATDVQLFLDQVVGESAVLAGHSLGGLVASYVASRPDAKLRGIFLEDPPLYRARMPALKETHFYDFFAVLRDLLRAHHSTKQSLEDLDGIVGSFPADPLQPDDGTMRDVMGDEAVRLRAIQFQSMDPDALSAVIEGIVFDDFDPDRDLAKIVCPTHLLAGSEVLGGAMTATDIREVSERIPSCSTTVWGDIGHLIHQARAESYAAELLSFLDEAG
jgi:pimeloyl-ACP methyl ester carboxylesterase